ncbi:MAG TPA: hypothetical protein VNT75_04185 [Symbiobacteriaceae bacterium]|nr:hypothetical protein [Symbiobacteriaceae bacterium]
MIRRWVSEQMDQYVFEVIKLAYRGYKSRMPAYRPPVVCEAAVLGSLGAPEVVDLTPGPDWQGYGVQEFRFPSPMECSAEENRYVYGRLLTAAPGAPWVLLVPGYSTGALPPYGFGFFQDIQALALLKQGLNTALIALPYHLGRKRAGHGSGEGFFSPDLADMQSTFRQAAADAIALVRWLHGRSGRPAGIWGTSLGGNVAGMVAARVPELAAVVLMEPLDNPGDSLRHNFSSREIREALAASGVSPDLLIEALRPVAPSSYPPAVPADRILFISPLWDRVIPFRFQDAFWEAWGRPERITVAAGHLTMPPDPGLNARVAAFLSRWLT